MKISVASPEWLVYPLFPGRTGMFVFVEGVTEPAYPEKTLRSRDENQQQNQATYDAGSLNRTRATLVGGESASPLRHPANIMLQP